jgi:porphobilinogen synthase
MVRETSLSPDNFIYPLFITYGKNVRKEIKSMPGCYQESVDVTVKHAKVFSRHTCCHSSAYLNIRMRSAPGAFDPHGEVQKAIGAIKNKVPGLYVVGVACANTRATAAAS